jgi:hypothetical protein
MLLNRLARCPGIGPGSMQHPFKGGFEAGPPLIAACLQRSSQAYRRSGYEFSSLSLKGVAMQLSKNPCLVRHMFTLAY